ncbi:hypothetical protein EW146_g9171 [Bondarzewia mesenterica]|uniref:Uncharacterized protein n=1 Tax=Bondarzewia mesenterica TaxID=1095465 RepID=A0A4S4L8P9_9AGAM|nr:hypothetical protein EW146_g9171 [Bondarzewia mesenterica]
MAYHIEPQISAAVALGRAAAYIPLCFGVKSLIMTIDDLLDYDVDAKVERTRNRPIPRGAISLERAWLFFTLQVVIGIFSAVFFLGPTAHVILFLDQFLPEFKPMSNALQASIISLGSDLCIGLPYVHYGSMITFSLWVKRSNMLGRAKKHRNRYLAPCFIILTLLSYFSASWTLDVYAFIRNLIFRVALLTILQVFSIRIHGDLGNNAAVPSFTAVVLLWQWGIALYAMSQSSAGTDQPALLLSRDALPPLPTLPSADPYHICIFISTLTVTPWVEAFLCIGLSFDGLVFLTILTITMKASRAQEFEIGRVMKVIQRDGIVYFSVLFSSNLVWLLLLLHARPGLKFMHNQISSIMINRITLNLKRASLKQSIVPWGIRTFEEHDKGSTSSTLASSDAPHGGEEFELQIVRH